MNASSPGARPSAQLDPVLHGISLTQFAAVTAALADGFELPAVLAVEGVAPAAWPRAEAAWKARLVEESLKEGQGLFPSYRSRLAEAEDRLARRITPLESDLAAWTVFLKAYSSHPSPFELLSGVGLGVNDVSRLSRLWTRRLAGSPELQERAAELAREAGAELPVLRIEPGVLTPSAAAAARAETASADAAREAPLVLPSAYRPSSREAPPEEVPAPQGTAAAPPAPLPSAHPAPLPPGTAQSLDIPRGPALPFAPADPDRPSPLALPAPRASGPVVHRAPGALTGTAPLSEAARGPALPFPEASAPPGEATQRPPVVPAPPALTGTAPLSDVPRGPALPFPEASAPPGAALARPPVVQAPPALTGTAPLADVASGPALPFAAADSGRPAASPPLPWLPPSPVLPPPSPVLPSPSPVLPSPSPVLPPPSSALPPPPPVLPPPPALPSPPRAARPVVHRAPEALTGTSLRLDIPRGAALPFAREPSGGTAAGAARPATPAPGPPSPPLLLPLEQHAALTLELVLDPGSTEEILRRYRLSAADKERLDAHWTQRFAEDPPLWAQWHEAYRAHHARLLSAGRIAR
ncbi:hypothetical protein [Sorangium sp. So ce131]|uniref:hypothetical protein n=1 Tax=Sorangium sp. So ce131 TaxID=3133282 RepID=UPI003F63918D